MNVYDFDNTIYDGESCFDFLKFYIKKRPSLIAYLPRVTFAFLKYKMGKVTVDRVFELYAPKVEEFFASIEDIEADAEEFWNIYEKNIKPFYADIQRDDDVIITASPEATIGVICKRLGIKNLIGSVVNSETGKIERLCMRSNKIAAFLEKYPDGKIDNFYTDSPKNDKPLIDMSEHAFIVKGNKITQVK